jgi:hypothetical protein
MAISQMIRSWPAQNIGRIHLGMGIFASQEGGPTGELAFQDSFSARIAAVNNQAVLGAGRVHTDAVLEVSVSVVKNWPGFLSAGNVPVIPALYR